MLPTPKSQNANPSNTSQLSSALPNPSGNKSPQTLAATALDGTTAVAFTSGAKRSKVMPRFDLLPYEALQCLADRFELGAKKYAKDNWKKGASDPDFNADALSHMQHHLSCFINEDFSEDDAWGHLGAIMWGAATRAWKIKQDEKVK